MLLIIINDVEATAIAIITAYHDHCLPLSLPTSTTETERKSLSQLVTFVQYPIAA
jgi:hypothetical protein